MPELPEVETIKRYLQREILGKKISAAGSFKQVNYGGTFFRYLSFQEKNLGICWAIYQDYLIITSSGESIMKTIDFLKTNPAETN